MTMRRSAAWCLCLIGLVLPGCNAIGVIAGKTGHTVMPAVYTGLSNQSLGVMVVADPGTRTDFPRIQLDMAENLTTKLKETQKRDVPELKGTTFPRSAAPDAVYAFQRNYPQLEWEPIANVAPKLGVTRLIYLEVEGFSLHPNNVPELFRGELTARVQVIEVSGNSAKSAFKDRITATFPQESNSPGVLNANSRDIYRRTIDVMSTSVIERFVTHDVQ